MDAADSDRLIIAAAVIVADQATKVLSSMTSVGLGPISITQVMNTGGSFGFFQGYNVVITVVALAVLAMVWWYRTSFPVLSAGLIIGGGVGNVVDRVLRGHVVDFISIGWWPVFNVADIAISVGALFVVLEEIRLSPWFKERE